MYGQILMCKDVAAVEGYPGFQVILRSLIHKDGCPIKQ